MAIKRDDLIKQLMKDFEYTSSDTSYGLKKQCDRLSGYAHVAIEALVAEGKADFVFLKHDGMREWWQERQAEVRRQEEAAVAKKRKAELRAQALLKLTAEERKALGIK